jgi:hypothetical protein
VVEGEEGEGRGGEVANGIWPIEERERLSMVKR